MEQFFLGLTHLFPSYQLDLPISLKFKGCWVVFFIFFLNFKRTFCKQTVETDQTVLDLHCLPMSHKKDVIFFKINFFEKILSGIPSECQTVWIQIRPNISGLIWVQSVCKSYP